MDQPAVETTSRRRKAAVGALVCVVALAACAGENLFTGVLVTTEGGGGPVVEITAPAANATFTVGQTVPVTASVTSDAGAASARVSGHYDGSDTPAYNEATVNLFNAPSTEFNATLNPAPGQIAGLAYIVVQVSDQLGGIGKDSVKVTIN